jgi:N-acetylglucosamine-6-phosphate deacetylase
METSAACWGISEADVNKALVAIDAGTLFTPERKFSPGRLLIEGRTITAAGAPDSIHIPANANHIDASKLLVAPGFIDPHVHGCCGVDVMEGSHESINAVSRVLVRHGTTSFLPTTVSSPPDVLTRAVEQLGAAMAKPFDGAQPLGIHLEGPFISAAKRGTHRATNVLSPDPNLLEHWILASGNTVRLLTVAPELNGIEPVLIMAQHFGVTIAMGHSNATFEEAQAAVERGVHYAVHAFNAMRPFAHRDPGIVGLVLADDRIFAEIIADGIHVDESVVRIFARAKGTERVLLVTDAVSATDMPDGRYALGGDTVEVINGICRNAEGRLAGSTLTQEIALRNFVGWTKWPFEQALPGLTSNPARALKLEKKGVLEPGADADVVIMDEQFRVMKTLVAGRVVFERS